MPKSAKPTVRYDKYTTITQKCRKITPGKDYREKCGLSPASSGVIMQVSPCHPRSSIFATATAMPALIFSASKPGGNAGSEKSTVFGRLADE